MSPQMKRHKINSTEHFGPF